MRAEQLGELLLTQAVSTWDERELEYCRVSGGIYFFAQLLRGGHFTDQEVVLPGEGASLSEIADAVEKLDFAAVPAFWKDVVTNGIAALRDPTVRDTLIDLQVAYTHGRYFPPPFSAVGTRSVS